jgi:quercetin dioxygenase-like cupin family protein
MQPISRDILLEVGLGQAKDTHRIEIRRIRIVPGHAAGLHVHNGPVVGSIVEGSVVFQVDGEPESVLRPGDVFFEPEGARIARFDAQDAGVTFLAYFLLGPGQEPEITFPDD